MKSARNYKIGGGVVIPPPSDRLVLKLNVNALTNPLLRPADFKYNKDVVFMGGFDDSNLSHLRLAYPIFQGGLAMDGITYPGLRYSDGTGKMINFRGMLVMVAGDVKEESDNSTVYHTWTQAREALANGWEISNHTAYQDRDQSSRVGPHPWDSLNNLLDAEKKIWQETGYRPTINTAPADDEGYMYTARELGYIAHSSNTYENNMDVVIWDKATPATLEQFMSVETTGWFNLVRENFGDESSSEGVGRYKEYIDVIFSRAVNGAKWMGNWYTHGPDPTKGAQFAEIYNYILNHPSNTNQNRIWIPSVAEFLQYLHVKKDSVITQEINGNVLTITVDQSALNSNFRCRDISLLATGFTIGSIQEIEGWDDVTFNSSTGLINLYKTAVNKATDPSLQILPAQIISLVASGNTVLITYDKAVTQSLITAYTVPGKTVVSISGTGKNWTLTCNSAVNPGDTMSYRMYNGTSSFKGDAITVSTGKRVCDYINFPIS